MKFELQRIESTKNTAFKQALKWLKAPAAKNRTNQVAWCEGLHLAFEVFQHAAHTIEQVWLPQSLFQHNEFSRLKNLLTDCATAKKPESLSTYSVFEVPDWLYCKLSEQECPVGPLVVFKPLVVESTSAQIQQHGLSDWVILDGVQDPNNLGAILRTCAAASVQHIGLTSGCAWPWGSKALRAGMGAQWHLKFFESHQLPNFSQSIYATHLASSSVPLYSLNLTQPTVWVFGHEGQGVCVEWLEKANCCVRIPQSTAVESLNVASSVAIVLFEQMRQRINSINC